MWYRTDFVFVWEQYFSMPGNYCIQTFLENLWPLIMCSKHIYTKPRLLPSQNWWNRRWIQTGFVIHNYREIVLFSDRLKIREIPLFDFLVIWLVYVSTNNISRMQQVFQPSKQCEHNELLLKWKISAYGYCLNCISTRNLI